MLYVKTKIGPSKIHGTGLFADQFIPKGTTTWEWHENLDTTFTEEEVGALPELIRDYILYYAYRDEQLNKLVLCADSQRYINHSRNTNITSTTRKDVAARDIEIGEELLCDYNLFDPTYFIRLGLDESTLNS